MPDAVINAQVVNLDLCCPPVTGNGGAFSVHREDIGDGVSTSFLVAHGSGMMDVVPVVRSNVTGVIDEGSPTTTVLNANTVRIDFANPPSPGEYHVMVISFMV